MYHASAPGRPGLFLGCVLLAALAWPAAGQAEAPKERNAPYRELTGTAEEFRSLRDWRSYYWREDFTFILRDDGGQTYRVISREPTPWTDLRLGTTYTGLAVDWAKKPRVRVIGVGGIDRLPPDFHDVKLETDRTVTAFILRVQTGRADDDSGWRDYYVNNWFHHWGNEADRKVLPHYANKDPHYTVYGYVGGIAAPLDAEGRKLLAKYQPEYGGIIYHGRVVKADNEVGYEVHLLHLMGRNKKTSNYDVFHGNPIELVKLDGRPPKPGK
jgi:hypothetical protein